MRLQLKYPFHHKANYKLFKYAKDMRSKPTDAEALLWSYLKNRQQLGAKFRRQHPLGNYIVDFYCHEHLLAIEVDGSIHCLHDNPTYDQDRTEFLNHVGIRVIRFTNDNVLQDIDQVMQTIRNHLVQLPISRHRLESL